MSNVGVHASHCCKTHGCKYGDNDCPVVSGEVEAKYSCEDCDQDRLMAESAMKKAVELGLCEDTPENLAKLVQVIGAANMAYY